MRMAGADGGLQNLLGLLVIVVTAGLSASDPAGDIRMITFADSGSAVDIYTTSEHSQAFGHDTETLRDQRLSEICISSPDCAKLLHRTSSLDSDITQVVIVLPLETGIALLEYRYSGNELTQAESQVFDKGCSTTAVVQTDNGNKGPFFVCLTPSKIFIYEIMIGDRVQDSSLPAMEMFDVDTSNVSNFIYTFMDGEDRIVYASGNDIFTIQLPLFHYQHLGKLANCSKVDRLERVRGTEPEIWARCEDGSTKSFDITLQSENISSPESFRFVCPDPGVILEVVDDTFIKYGLESTSTFEPNTPLPGSRFRSDLSVCFSMQGVTFLAFVDEQEGVYLFNSSASDAITKLSELQACSPGTGLCKQLLVFENRYLHVREPDGNTLVDVQNLEVLIDHQFTEVEFVAVLKLEMTPPPTPTSTSLPSPSPTTPSSLGGSSLPTAVPSSSPPVTGSNSSDDHVIIGSSVGGAVLILVAVIIVAAVVYCRCRRPAADAPPPPIQEVFPLHPVQDQALPPHPVQEEAPPHPVQEEQVPPPMPHPVQEAVALQEIHGEAVEQNAADGEIDPVPEYLHRQLPEGDGVNREAIAHARPSPTPPQTPITSSGQDRSDSSPQQSDGSASSTASISNDSPREPGDGDPDPDANRPTAAANIGRGRSEMAV